MEMARPGNRCILSIDQGSSSLKTAVYELGIDNEQRLLEGAVERLGTPDAILRLHDYRGSAPRETSKALGEITPVAALLQILHEQSVHIDGVGHRLVYGGSAHEVPACVTAGLMSCLDALVPVDPLHLPSALAAIREIEATLPTVPQVVCFDTAFHRSMPTVAQRLPLPRELWTEGVRRYGFHGLSYESIVRKLGYAGSRGRMVVAHLGNGASLAAIRDGTSLDTTMGFSPLGGLMMGTRPGDLDPGALLYLLRAKRYTVAELDDVLNHRSGLLGVSQCSADMHTLLDRRVDDVYAAEAVELFVYEAKKHIGALVAVLGGLDTLVFTGGMGEHSAAIRSEIAAGLAHLGVELDPARNADGAPIISSDDARVTVRMIPANEDLMVARHTFATLFASSIDEADRPSTTGGAHAARATASV